MPIALKTRRKASGRSQAAVNAAIAPLLEPAMQRSLPSLREPDRPAVGGRLLLDLGQQLVEQEPGVVVAQAVVLVAAIEAVERLSVEAPSPRPGVTNTPMMTGISFLWISSSKTAGALN